VEHVWDINDVLNDESGVGLWLKALFGYNSNPSLLEVIAYPLYLVVAFFYFVALRPIAPQAPVRRSQPSPAQTQLVPREAEQPIVD